MENPEARQRCAAVKAPGEPARQGWVFTRLLFALWDAAMRWPFTSMGLYWESHITDKDRARSCKIFKDAVIILSFVKKKKWWKGIQKKKKGLRFLQEHKTYRGRSGSPARGSTEEHGCRSPHASRTSYRLQARGDAADLCSQGLGTNASIGIHTEVEKIPMYCLKWLFFKCQWDMEGGSGTLRSSFSSDCENHSLPSKQC